MDIEIENDAPEVDQSTREVDLVAHRQERFTKVGNLPLEYRTHLIIVGPNGDVSIQADAFTLWELAGLLEMCQSSVRQSVRQMLLQSNKEAAVLVEDSAQQRLF